MTEIKKYEDKIKNVRSLLERSKDQMRMALPRHMSPDRLARIAMTTVQRVPKLLDCTPQSFIGAVIQCAQLGLEPDDLRGSAYLIPFRNNKKQTMEVQLIAGYKGLLDLARRSAQVSTIEARVVYDGDKFTFRYGLDPYLIHEPDPRIKHGDGAITHFYAIARLKDGGKQFEVMTKDEVEEVRDRYSRAKNEGPWVTNFREMGLKTVLRRLAKLLPTSPELSTAVALEEMHESGLPQDLSVFASDVASETGQETTSGSKLDTLTKTLDTDGEMKPETKETSNYELDLLAMLPEIKSSEGLSRLFKQHQDRIDQESKEVAARILKAFRDRERELTPQGQGRLM